MNGQVKVSFLCVENSGGINLMMLSRFRATGLPAYDFFIFMCCFATLLNHRKNLLI